MMTILGLNGFFQFMPSPEPTAGMGAYLGALAATGYMFPMISLVEFISGILVLINKYTPLALLVVFTVLINAFLAHIFLDPSTIGMAALAVVLNVTLLVGYKDKYLKLISNGESL